MSASGIQLAALGMQDAYLTGKPSVTYFKGVYRRHTPFSIQAFNIPFENQQISWGGQGICRVPYKGDAIQSTTLAVTLPGLFPYSTQYQWPTPVNVQRPVPYLNINGSSTPLSVSAGTIDYYYVTTVLGAPFWAGALTPYLGYDPSAQQFYFRSAVSSVTMNIADAPNVGVFFGLDPHAFTSYTSNTLTWTFPNTGSNSYVNFTLAESGWQQYNPSATFNQTTSLLFAGGAILTSTQTSPNGLRAQFSNLNAFASQQGYTTYFRVTPGGCLKFAYPGTYALIFTGPLSGPVTRIGIGYSGSDGHPITTNWTQGWNLAVYTYDVVSLQNSPRVIVPMTITDTTQYYFIDLETQSNDPLTLGSTTEFIVTDLSETWTLNTTSALQNKTVNLASNWSQAFFSSQIIPSLVSNTFTMTSAGTYLFHGFLASTGNVASVYVWSVDQAKVVSEWSTNQYRSPTVMFTLPVYVASPSTNVYSVIVTTTDAGPTTLLANSYVMVETIGSPNSYTIQQNDFKQNGVFFQAQSTQNVSLGLRTLNFATGFTEFGGGPLGGSRHVHVTAGGNITFSNTSQYRLSSYFETSNAYVSNVSLYQSSSDAGPWTLVASTPLNLGTVGPYVLDLLANCSSLTTNVYQVQVGLGSMVPGQVTTNVTSNTFLSVVGSTGVSPNSYSYVDSVGTFLIESAELRIGGQSVQTLTGEMIELLNDLNVPQENQPGLTLLTGKLDTSTAYQLQGTLGRTYYMNLPFFFYGNAEVSLPACALGRQDLEIWITFRTFTPLMVNATNWYTPPQYVVTSMIVEYAYMSDPEVNWFSSHRLDYVIQQTQMDTFQLGRGTTFDLNFVGPVREIFFLIQDASATPYVYVTDPGISLTLTLNGEDYLDGSTLEYDFLRYIGPLRYHSRQPNRIFHVVSFAQDPRNPRPSGSLNMSRVYQKKFILNVPDLPSLTTKQLRVIAFSYNVLRVENGLAGILYQ
jgi:hypothetical protein